MPTSTATDKKLYVQVVTLPSQDNVKLREQLKSGFKRTINWNKYQSKKITQTQNQNLDYLGSPSFQVVTELWDIEQVTSDVFFQT